MQKQHYSAPRSGILDTLAQSGTIKTHIPSAKREITVQGNGTETQNLETLKGRAKRKMISQKLVLSLIDVAIGKGEPERIQPYWNTYHCQNRVISANGRLYGKYCKNRFCTVCSAIRKADIINRYLPEVQTWLEPYFVTLTAKAVPACKLKSRIDRMLQSIKKIIARNRKRALRGIGIMLVGIKSLECNFNPIKRTYNPHFHLIVANELMAEIFMEEWLKQCTPEFANKCAQHMRRVENTERDLIEIVKYGTKVFTDTTMKKKAKSKVTPFVYVSAIDRIITAMSGHRIFDRFGFDLKKLKKVKGGKQTRITDYAELFFDPYSMDWIDPETEQALSGYEPSPELMAIWESNIDMNLM